MHSYVKTVVNNLEDADDPVDSDGMSIQSIKTKHYILSCKNKSQKMKAQWRVVK